MKHHRQNFFIQIVTTTKTVSVALAMLCFSGMALAEPNPCPHIKEPLTSDMILKCDIKTAKEIIPLLPESYLSNVTFGYSQASLMGECFSKLNPRVILFSPTSDVVVALPWSANAVETKDGKLLNCNVIEMMELKKNSTELSFLTKVLPLVGVENVAEHLLDQRLKTRACSECHDGRPLWGGYPTWPNFYGGNEDTILMGSDDERDFKSFMKKMTQEERSYFRGLVVKRSTILSGPSKDVYLLGARTANLPLDVYVSLPPYQLGRFPSRGPHELRPNIRLGKKLTDLLGRRNYARALRQPDFQFLKLTASLNAFCGGGDPRTFVGLATQLKKRDPGMFSFAMQTNDYYDGAKGEDSKDVFNKYVLFNDPLLKPLLRPTAEANASVVPMSAVQTSTFAKSLPEKTCEQLRKLLSELPSSK